MASSSVRRENMSVPWARASMRIRQCTARLESPPSASPSNRQAARAAAVQQPSRYICLRGKSMNGQLWPRWRKWTTKLSAGIRRGCKPIADSAVAACFASAASISHHERINCSTVYHNTTVRRPYTAAASVKIGRKWAEKGKGHMT